MKSLKTWQVFTLLALCVLHIQLACSIAENGPDPRPEVLTALAANVIIPRYADFQLAMDLAAAEVEAFCAEPSQDGLELSRLAISEAYLLWKRSEVIAFGPHREQPWAIAGKLDLWPVRPENVQEVLDGEGAVDEEGLISVINGAKGLPAVQWLLWERGEDSLEAFTGSAAGQRRCALLTGLSAEAASRAATMVQAWSSEGDDWQLEFANPPGPLGRFLTSQDAVSELVNRMIFTVENIRLLKLGKPIGFEAQGQIQPDRLEAPYSGNSLAACRANLAGLVEVFHGSYGNSSGKGLADLLPEARRAELVTSFDLAMSDSEQSLASITEPLSATIFAAPDEVEATIEILRQLQVVLQVDIAQALAVTVRFNDTDGD